MDQVRYQVIFCLLNLGNSSSCVLDWSTVFIIQLKAEEQFTHSRVLIVENNIYYLIVFSDSITQNTDDRKYMAKLFYFGNDLSLSI